jgi:hypothetical protein
MSDTMSDIMSLTVSEIAAPMPSCGINETRLA